LTLGFFALFISVKKFKIIEENYTMNYIIRKMTAEDIEQVLQLMAEDDFIVGVGTLNTIIQIDSNGILVAEEVDKSKFLFLQFIKTKNISI
jgi:hypothetical protein